MRGLELPRAEERACAAAEPARDDLGRRMREVQTLSDRVIELIEEYRGYCTPVGFTEIMSVSETLRAAYRVNASPGPSRPRSTIVPGVLLRPLTRLGAHLSAQARKKLEASLTPSDPNSAGADDALVKLDFEYEQVLKRIHGHLEALAKSASEADSYLAQAPTALRAALARKDELMDLHFLQELADLIATAPRGVAQSVNSRRGAVVSDYSVESLADRFARGLECLTLRDRQERLVGTLLFYPPQMNSEIKRRVATRTPRDLSGLSENDLCLLHPDVQGTVGCPLLMGACDLHLRRFGARGQFTEVLSTNKASKRAFEKCAGILQPDAARVVPPHELGDEAPKDVRWVPGFVPLKRSNN